MRSDSGPVDADAFAFHSTEPGHLPLGKLVNGGGELRAHLVVGQFPYDVLGDELVFESVVDEVFRCYGLDFWGVFRIIRYTFRRCFDECRPANLVSLLSFLPPDVRPDGGLSLHSFRHGLLKCLCSKCFLEGMMCAAQDVRTRIWRFPGHV